MPAGLSDGRVPATAMTASWMAGSQRARCYRHAAEGYRGGESYESFMKHLILLNGAHDDFPFRKITMPIINLGLVTKWSLYEIAQQARSTHHSLKHSRTAPIGGLVA
jgi:hypothetical protein